MGVHDGHRARLRERFTEHGLDNFNDVNALELLLFYAIPRKDTNEIAHRLLEHFGSLYEVLNASVQELCGIPGISYNSAVLISMIPQMMKKSEVSRTLGMRQIKNYQDARKYLEPRFTNERDEILLMLCLDSSRNIICCKEVARGSVDTVEANIRRIIEMALKAKAVSVILAHNHPGGQPRASIEDEYLTDSIYKALKALGIKLEDHIIVADEQSVSFANAGIMQMFRF